MIVPAVLIFSSYIKDQCTIIMYSRQNAKTPDDNRLWICCQVNFYTKASRNGPKYGATRPRHENPRIRQFLIIFGYIFLFSTKHQRKYSFIMLMDTSLFYTLPLLSKSILTKKCGRNNRRVLRISFVCKQRDVILGVSLTGNLRPNCQ